MIKVLAFDIDGTLSYKANSITPTLRNELNRLQEEGFRIILATGRPYEDLLTFQRKNDFYTEAILLNGAAIIDQKQKLGFFQYIDQRIVKSVCEVLRGFDVPFVCFTSKGNFEYICSRMRYGDVMKKYLGDESELKDLIDSFVFVDKQVFNYEEVFKIEIMFENLHEIGKVKDALSKIKQIQVVSSMNFNLEITSSSTNKGKILKNYIESLGYQEDEVMIFGDSENDRSMFELFSNSVLVENPENDFSCSHKYKALPCKEDGVAIFLREYFR